MKQVETRSAQVRARLDHPIIDGDGHTIEVIPLFLDYVREVGGPKVFEKFMGSLPGLNRERDATRNRIGGVIGWWGLSPEERREKRATRASFWRFQTGTSLDRATVMLPALYRKRLDEFGIDFSVVYTTTGLNFMRSADDEIRRVACRALNTMYADIFGPHADRMTVPAVIPMYTPEEAIEELDFAIGKLGLKAAVLAALVPRPIRDVARRIPEASQFATYVDAMAQDSEYDYDPVWRKCVDLKVAVTVHSGSMGFGTRTSPDNFVYNHIGHFAAAGEAICKAIVLGGVVRRFPTLRFAFLEGGVGWACGLYNDFIEHWETRSVKTIKRASDPSRFNAAEFAQLFAEYGGAALKDRVPPVGTNGSNLSAEVPPDLDDWAAAQIGDERDFKQIFANFFFGCEAGDRMTAVAFNPKLNQFDAKIQALLGSDIGHFDVPDFTAVIAEAHELVEDGLIGEDDFRDFTFANAVKLHGSMNPAFFQGTIVESAAESILRGG